MFRGCFGRSKDASGARNAVHPTRGTPNNLSPKRVHVTFGESKRVLCLSEEDEVGKLRQKFLQTFPNFPSDDIAVANVQFQQYDHTFKEYVDIENEMKLENNAKVKAVIIPFRENKKPDSGEGITLLPVNLKVPSKDIVDTLREDVRYHTLKKDVPYRLWNLVSNGLIQPMPDKPTVVTCSGNFGDANTVIKPIFYGSNLFYLMYTDSNQSNMYLTAKGESEEITLESTESDAALFEPNYYYGFTVFRNKPWNSLYLGCDNNKSAATLVEMKDVNYPNPQALFTVNKYELE